MPHQQSFDDFETFWRLYPRKVAKFAALRAYARARLNGATEEELLGGVRRYREHKPEYAEWCHASTFLSQGRWLDEYDDDAPKAEPGAAEAFLQQFGDLYRRHRSGARYFARPDKDLPTLRPLLLLYGADRLAKLAVVLLTTDDEWVSGTDRGIGILAARASWLDGMLSAYESKHGAIKVA